MTSKELPPPRAFFHIAMIKLMARRIVRYWEFGARPSGMLKTDSQVAASIA